MIRTLIVDDEPLAREGLRLLLAGEPDVEIVGEAADADEAVKMIREHGPDLLLLDVQMPGASGFDVLQRIATEPLPAVVFVSAHDQFALRAFEVHALDYLLKPPSRERLAEAVRRVRDAARREDPAGAVAIRNLLETLGGTPAPAYIERFVVRERQRYLLVPARDTIRIEAAGNYAEIHARGRTYLIRETMTELERQLDPAKFARIHRSTIVSIDHVTEIEPDGGGDFLVTLDDGTELKMTRGYRERLLPRG
jgi:two-component system LytT family response regulator